MISIQKILDELKGDRPSKLEIMFQTPRKLKNEIIERLNEAECFDFGKINLEKGASGNFQVPTLTEDEKDFYREGLMPFPSPVCWFEFQIETRTGLLIDTTDPECIGIQVFDFFQTPEKMGYLYGFWMVMKYSNMNEVRVHSNDKAFLSHLEVFEKEVYKTFAPNVYIALYLNLMLNSKTTELTREDAPVKLNKAKQKRGKTTIPSHRIVTITPSKFLDSKENKERGSHSSPRLHWRRSHRRTLANGKVTVVVRHIVGRKELGEVTHEYRIKP